MTKPREYAVIVHLTAPEGSEEKLEHAFKTADVPADVRSVDVLDETDAIMLAERNKGIVDLDKEVVHLEDQLRLKREHIVEIDRELKQLKTTHEAVVMQLQRLAQHKDAVYIPDADSVRALADENRSLNTRLAEAEKQTSFLEGVRTDNGARFIDMRERIWELEAGYKPELLALQAEKDFWRAKAKELMKR